MQVFCLCFLADRFFTTRLWPSFHRNEFLSTLVFPLTWCSLEYLSSFNPEKATWTSLAYTQAENLPLLQFVSVTGIWGVSFLVTWFASVVNWIWSQNFQWDKIRRGVIMF